MARSSSEIFIEPIPEIRIVHQVGETTRSGRIVFRATNAWHSGLNTCKDLRQALANRAAEMLGEIVTRSRLTSNTTRWHDN